MPLNLSDDDDEPIILANNKNNGTTAASTNDELKNNNNSSADQTQGELLEFGYVPVLPTSSSEIDSKNLFSSSEKGGLFDSDSDDELELLSHHHYNNNRNSSATTLLGIENSKIIIGIIILGIIFLLGFSLLLSYRMIEKPIERQSPKYVGLSLLWSTTVCKQQQQTKDSANSKACQLVSDRVKTDKNNFIISSFKPTTDSNTCDDPNFAPYVAEKLPATTSDEYKQLVSKYAPYWPPEFSNPVDWTTSYNSYGRCLYVNDTAITKPVQFFGLAIGLWQHWTNVIYGNFKLTTANSTEISYSSVGSLAFMTPKCTTVAGGADGDGDRQYLLGLDICILGDTLEPATESALCEFTATNCDPKKSLEIV